MSKILIVEDDAFISEMYSNKLKKAGFEIQVIKDGEEAIKQIPEIKPDLILLDIVLPKMDGFEILKRIKENPQMQNIKVVLLTNLGQEEDIKKGLQLKADAYMIKAHFTPTQVVDQVNELLKS